MIRTHILDCNLNHAEADALNRASGGRYSQVMVFHWRVYRHRRHWLSTGAAERWNDRLNAGQPPLLHAHSIDAAQQAFAKACKTAKANRHLGAKYPHKRMWFRTTIWKQSAIRHQGDRLLLSRAKGHPPITIHLPEHLHSVLRFLEVRLVYDKAKRRYFWHLVVENGKQPKSAPGTKSVAVDLGEVHPAALSDGQDAVVISCRELRSQRQYTAKRLAALRARQAKCKHGSRLWKRLQRRISRFLHQQTRRTRDLEHKISREVVKTAVEMEAGTLAIGDVRDAADGVALGKKANQKVSMWSHGRLRTYITYKAEAEGIKSELVDERYTSQTCPSCRKRHKPRSRVYTCGQCGFSYHRDGGGAVNILSVYVHGEPGCIRPRGRTMYRLPFRRLRRSPLDTGQVAYGHP